MKIAVIGAGLMGRAVLFDLAKIKEVKTVGVFDIDKDLAAEVGEKFGNGKARSGQLNASDVAAAARLLTHYYAAVSCVTYKYNPGLTKAAIEAGCHFVDLGGYNFVVRAQLLMVDVAKQTEVICISDCGIDL